MPGMKMTIPRYERLRQIDEAWALLAEAGISTESLRDILSCSSRIVKTAEKISREVVSFETENHNMLDRRIDRIVTSRTWGILIMLALLEFRFLITIKGSELPLGTSWQMACSGSRDIFRDLIMRAGGLSCFHDMLILGMYRTLAWVVPSCRLPWRFSSGLFTLLEDLGYLPRVAFNLDNFFKKACAHGKQALTMAWDSMQCRRCHRLPYHRFSREADSEPSPTISFRATGVFPRLSSPSLAYS